MKKTLFAILAAAAITTGMGHAQARPVQPSATQAAHVTPAAKKTVVATAKTKAAKPVKVKATKAKKAHKPKKAV